MVNGLNNELWDIDDLEKHTTYTQIVFNKFSTMFTLQDCLNLNIQNPQIKRDYSGT